MRNNVRLSKFKPGMARELFQTFFRSSRQKLKKNLLFFAKASQKNLAIAFSVFVKRAIFLSFATVSEVLVS